MRLRRYARGQASSDDTATLYGFLTVCKSDIRFGGCHCCPQNASKVWMNVNSCYRLTQYSQWHASRWRCGWLSRKATERPRSVCQSAGPTSSLESGTTRPDVPERSHGMCLFVGASLLADADFSTRSCPSGANRQPSRFRKNSPANPYLPISKIAFQPLFRSYSNRFEQVSSDHRISISTFVYCLNGLSEEMKAWRLIT